MPTFTELGIPFDLFEADVSLSTNYVGRKMCCLTKQVHEHCFELSIGDYVRHTCQSCSKKIYLLPTPDSDREKLCPHCQSLVPEPLAKEGEAFVCYESIQQGDVVFTKDSEFGMISWEQLGDGWTHGVPGLETTMFETRESEDGWVQVKLPKQMMIELVKTPDFHTWQGSRWLFYDGKPMTFVGEWQKQDFIKNCPKEISPENYLHLLMEDASYIEWDDMESMCFYVFKDTQTDTLRAIYDHD